MFTDVIQMSLITIPRQAGFRFPASSETGEEAAWMSLVEAQHLEKALAFAHKYFESVFGIPSEYMVPLWVSSVEANVHLLSLEFSILTLE